MKIIKWLVVFLVGCFLFSCSAKNKEKNGCSLNDYMQDSGKLKVLSTTAMIDDIVKRIGQDLVDNMVLIKGEIDPHSYELVKGDDEKISRANVLFYNGLGLEHGASLKAKLEKHGCSIAVGEYINQAYPKKMIYIDGTIDPHVWLDISLWVHIVNPIRDTLMLRDPNNAKNYEENAAKLQAELLQIHDELFAKMQQVPQEKRYLVTSHDAFNYFTRAYLCPSNEEAEWANRCSAPEGLAPEGQLSVSDIQRIVDYILSKHVHVVFTESNLSRDSLKKVVDACNSKGYSVRLAQERLCGDAMKESKDGYIGMVNHNISVLVSEWEKGTNE